MKKYCYESQDVVLSRQELLSKLTEDIEINIGLIDDNIDEFESDDQDEYYYVIEELNEEAHKYEKLREMVSNENIRLIQNYIIENEDLSHLYFYEIEGEKNK